MSSEHQAYNRLFSAVLLALLVAPFLVEIPEIEGASGLLKLAPPVCFVHQQTGEFCSGCGLTRSVVALYHGNLTLSRAYHPAGLLVVSVLIFQLFLRLMPLLAVRTWVLWVDVSQLVLAGLAIRWSL